MRRLYYKDLRGKNAEELVEIGVKEWGAVIDEHFNESLSEDFLKDILITKSILAVSKAKEDKREADRAEREAEKERRRVEKQAEYEAKKEEERKARYEKALDFGKAYAREHLGEEYGKVTWFFRNLKGKALKPEDYFDLVDKWKIIKAITREDLKILDGDVLDNLSVFFRKMFPTLGGTAEKLNAMSVAEKREFVESMLNHYRRGTETEYIKKDSVKVVKMNFEHIKFSTDKNEDSEETLRKLSDNSVIPSYDGSKVIRLNTQELGSSEIPTDPKKLKEFLKFRMREVLTAESAETRILESMGCKKMISICLDTSEAPPSQDEYLEELKYHLLRNGIIDSSTNTHYNFCLQSASGKRRAVYIFVEASKEEVFNIWFTLTGTKNIESFMKTFCPNGEMNVAQTNTRIASRASNTLDIEKRITEDEKKKIRDRKVLYYKDAETMISVPYKTVTAPGVLSLMDAIERTLKPGDGQIIASIHTHVENAKFLHLITIPEYDYFCTKWEEYKRNMEHVKEDSKLTNILKKVPVVYQLRHGACKGISVWYNYENIKIVLTEETAKMLNKRNIEQFVAGQEICLGDYDMLIPDSVRKFTAGEWKDYPLEICNWLKKKDDWVNLNQQFINALSFTKNALKPVIDFHFDLAIESLKNPAKGMIFHNIWKDEESEDIVPWAMRTNKHLAMDSQILKWRMAPYIKMVNEMLQGRIKVPGMYTYMIADPSYIIGNVFGIDVPCLKSGENYFNNEQCTVGLFRSPLIAQQNAQKIKAVKKEAYWYLKNVIIFNGFDGKWEFMSGADFDGDMSAVIPDNTEFGKIVVDHIVTTKPDLYTAPYNKVYTPFSFDDMEPYYRKLAQDASRDRTGVITNYAVRSQEIANHLLSAIESAKDAGVNTITLIHPKKFGINKAKDSYYGSDFVPCYNKEEDTFKIKGFVYCYWDTQKKEYVFNDDDGIYGKFTLQQIEDIAKQFSEKCEYGALKTYDEIDSAKTDIKAEGQKYGEAKRRGIVGAELEKLNEFVDSIKTVFSSHSFLTKSALKGKEIKSTDKCNSYISIAPLGCMVSYVNYRKHEIFDFFEDEFGVNLSSYLLTLLTAEEHEQLNRSLKTKSGFKTIVKCLDDRRDKYNNSIRNFKTMNTNGSADDEEDKDDNKRSIARIKEDERNFLLNNVCSYYNLSPEVVAVACYLNAYGRDSKKSLTFGWLLPEYLLSVFSRGNESFFNIPVKSTNVTIKDGYLYDDGNRRTPVNADDTDSVLVLQSIKGLVAHVHKKCKFNELTKQQLDMISGANVVTLYGSTEYTIKALGFSHYGETVDSWLNAVRQNNNEFNIRFNNNMRPCAFVNGKAISALELGKNTHICNNMSIRVKIVSKEVTISNGSIRDIKIVVVG